MPDTWRLGLEGERTRVAIVGCGGAGCNTLRRVTGPAEAIRIAVNDAPHPSMAGIPRRVFVRTESLRDVASMDEQVVQKMETHEEKDLASALLDRDLVLLLGGLGGELGGWAMGLVGRVARILGDTTLAFATMPFGAEGALRRHTAEAQVDLLRRKTDVVVTFANDNLLHLAPDLPLVRSFAILGGIMGHAAAGLGSVVARSDLVPLRRFLARSKEWRYGMGAGTEAHRCFLAVEEAYGSPWFTGRHEDVRRAVVLIGQPESGGLEEQVLHEIRLRSPLADLAWAVLPDPTTGARVVVQIVAGL